jgi:hypothetical protein
LRPLGRVVNSLSGILDALSCPFNQTKHTKTKRRHLNPILQDETKSWHNLEKCCSGVQGRQVLTALLLVDTAPASPPATPTPTAAPGNTKRRSEDATPRRIDPRQPPSRTKQSNQEPAAAARREANHRRVAPGDASAEQLQRQAKAGRRAALLVGRGRERSWEREMEGTTVSSIGRVGGSGEPANSENWYFPAGLVWLWCSWPHPGNCQFQDVAPTVRNQRIFILQFQPHCRRLYSQVAWSSFFIFLFFLKIINI